MSVWASEELTHNLTVVIDSFPSQPHSPGLGRADTNLVQAVAPASRRRMLSAQPGPMLWLAHRVLSSHTLCGPCTKDPPERPCVQKATCDLTVHIAMLAEALWVPPAKWTQEQHTFEKTQMLSSHETLEAILNTKKIIKISFPFKT